MPNLGAEASAAQIISWLVAVGDHVDVDDVMAEIETEKATLELNAPAAGKVVEIAAAAGTEVSVGGILAVIEQ
jgi:2-oxoisovalerate dehydrogenase E2 component (dihydrolipoyl transacylase)